MSPLSDDMSERAAASTVGLAANTFDTANWVRHQSARIPDCAIAGFALGRDERDT